LEFAPEGEPGVVPEESARRAEQRQFYAELKGPKHWIEIPGAGHSAHLDNPHVLFQRCLMGWIERL
jgi:pimeloyl-ACP methyl ester carboxylesterase